MARYDNEAYARYEDRHPRFWRKIKGRKVLEALKPENGDRILEIGCDTGWLVRKLMGHSKRVIGIDVNIAGLRIASMRNMLCMDAANMGFRDSSFDKIVCLHSLEHIREINEAFAEMSRVLKPTGSAILVYPFEVIRGICAMGSAWVVCPSISKAAEIHIHSISEARQQHVHKLYPRKISNLVEGNGLCPRGSIMFLDPWPAFLTVLEKRETVKKHFDLDVQDPESTQYVWTRNRYAENLA